jgi:hypothetical protein
MVIIYSKLISLPWHVMFNNLLIFFSLIYMYLSVLNNKTWHNVTLCVWKKCRKSCSELITMPLSWPDITAATAEKNSCTSSVLSESLGPTKYCQWSALSTNTLAQHGIQLKDYARIKMKFSTNLCVLHQ